MKDALIGDIFDHLAINSTQLDHADNVLATLPIGSVAEVNIDRIGVDLSKTKIRGVLAVTPTLSMVRVQHDVGDTLAFFQIQPRTAARTVKLREVISGDHGIFSFFTTTRPEYQYCMDHRQELEADLSDQERVLLDLMRNGLENFIMELGSRRSGSDFRTKVFQMGTIVDYNLARSIPRLAMNVPKGMYYNR